MPPGLPSGMHLPSLQHPELWQLLLRAHPYDSKLSDNLDSNEHFSILETRHYIKINFFSLEMTSYKF